MLNQVRTSSGCQNNQRVKFVYGPDHRKQRVHTYAWRDGKSPSPVFDHLQYAHMEGKVLEISSDVVMSRQRVDVQGVVGVWVQVNTSFVSNSTAKSYIDTFQVRGTKPTFTAEYSTPVF